MQSRLPRNIKITPKIVRELLDYNEHTGALVWKPRARHWFISLRAFRTWNARFAGKPAFTAYQHDGKHYQGWLLSRHFSAHTVIWAWKAGCWPTRKIAHINRNGLDNKWSNLREVSDLHNAWNKGISKRNTSGHTGIYRHHLGFWAVQICVRYQIINLGRFQKIQDAIAARKAAEQHYGITQWKGE